ncbi:MAG: NADH-quinone oxidoreductase subunit NuoK [Acidobacteriota bacterium]
MVTTTHYLVLSTLVFSIGVVGVLTRRNIIIIFMSIELMFNAVSLNLIAFSNHLQNLNGQVFAIFVITVAAAEAAVGLGILISLFRNKETVNVDQIDLMRG